MSFSPPQSTVSTPRCERWRNVEPATQTLLTHCWWSFTHLVFACFCTGMQLWITRSMRWGDRQKPPKVKTQQTPCFSKQLCLFSLLLYPSKGWRTGLSWCQLTGRRQLSPLPHPLWAILDTGSYLTKLLPASVLFSFFLHKSDFKCLAFHAGCRSALHSQTGPHRAKPNATPCRAWSCEQGPGRGPQRAAPPTHTASHHSLQINSRKDIRGHQEQAAQSLSKKRLCSGGV